MDYAQSSTTALKTLTEERYLTLEKPMPVWNVTPWTRLTVLGNAHVEHGQPGTARQYDLGTGGCHFADPELSFVQSHPRGATGKRRPGTRLVPHEPAELSMLKESLLVLHLPSSWLSFTKSISRPELTSQVQTPGVTTTPGSHRRSRHKRERRTGAFSFAAPVVMFRIQNMAFDHNP